MRDYDLNVRVTGEEIEANIDVMDIIEIYGADSIAEELSSKVLLQALNDQGYVCLILNEKEADFLRRMVLLLNAVATTDMTTLMEKLKCEL